MMKKMLTAAALAATMTFGAIAPALADGAASTRNIILGGAAAAVLAGMFGDDTAFTVTSDVRPGTRQFASFSAAVTEIANARVFGGIHFRISCVRGNALGQAVASYVTTHAMRAEQD